MEKINSIHRYDEESLINSDNFADEIIVKDIVSNWDNYKKEFTDNKDAVALDYIDAIWEYVLQNY